jgi:hypothetical protein
MNKSEKVRRKGRKMRGKKGYEREEERGRKGRRRRERKGEEQEGEREIKKGEREEKFEEGGDKQEREGGSNWVVWRCHCRPVAVPCDSSLPGSYPHAGGNGGWLCMLIFCTRRPALPCRDKTLPPCCDLGLGIPGTACGDLQASSCSPVPFPQRLHSP